MVVAPRLCCTLLRQDHGGLPLGPEVWGDTRIIQPFDTAASGYRNIFTGEVLAPDLNDGQMSLALKDILAIFPVALLERLDRNSDPFNLQKPAVAGGCRC